MAAAAAAEANDRGLVSWIPIEENQVLFPCHDADVGEIRRISEQLQGQRPVRNYLMCGISVSNAARELQRAFATQPFSTAQADENKEWNLGQPWLAVAEEKTLLLRPVPIPDKAAVKGSAVAQKPESFSRVEVLRSDRDRWQVKRENEAFFQFLQRLFGSVDEDARRHVLDEAKMAFLLDIAGFEPAQGSRHRILRGRRRGRGSSSSGRLRRRPALNRDPDSETWAFWCRRLTDTEIQFLYLLYNTREELREHFNYFESKVQVSFVSLLDVCDSCTLALCPASVQKVIGIDQDNIDVVAHSLDPAGKAASAETTFWRQVRQGGQCRRLKQAFRGNPIA
jgi:hypothetical protein